MIGPRLCRTGLRSSFSSRHSAMLSAVLRRCLGMSTKRSGASIYMAVPNAKAVRRAGALRRVMRGIGNLQKKRVMEDPPAGQWRVYYSSNEPVGGERRIHVDGLELDVKGSG
jgi:hypothetical protein